MNKLIHRLVQSWYEPKPRWWIYLLAPLSAIFAGIAVVRRTFYRVGLLKNVRCSVPVIVVGNITAGGVGKTPLTIYLAHLLRKQGFRPGIVSRGYRGDNQFCREVFPTSDPRLVGDEAVLLAQRTGCPMVIARDRPQAAQRLIDQHACDVILSDDGMQHYRLHRDIEIAVIDGERRLGNRLCMPAGPLREPEERLAEVDFIVANGKTHETNEYAMALQPEKLHNLLDPTKQRSLESWRGKTVHAIAAIGHPQRFFDSLQHAGLQIVPREFPDHYFYRQQDLVFSDALPVVMTEKDAVKCTAFAQEHWWSLPVIATVSPEFERDFLARLTTVIRTHKTG